MMDETEIRDRLTARRQKLVLQLRSSESTERHEVEQGLNDNAQLSEVSEVRDALDDEAAGELEQVNEALARLDEGVYGSCRSCSKPIGPERLESLPYATLCIHCAEKEE